MQEEPIIQNEKIQQILLKSQSLLDNEQFYEYEQKILTFGFRFINQNQKESAIHLYFQAAKQLLRKNNDNSGYNLTHKIIEISDNLDQNQIAQFLSVYSVAQFSKKKLEMINTVLKKYPNSRETICQQVGVDLINQEKYHLAWRYLVQTKETNAEITLLTKWNHILTEQEKEYNIIRYILIKLGIGLFEESKYIQEQLLPTTVTLPSLFMNLLIKAISLNSRKAYDELFEKFKIVIEQDPTFSDLYYKVGVRYFGLQQQSQQQQGGISGLLGSFFR